MPGKNSSSIVFMDLDGTITREDSYVEFIRFCTPPLKVFFGFLLMMPLMILFLLRIVRGSYAKERVLSFFFRGMEEERFKQLGKDFARNVLPGLVMDRAREEIDMHRKNAARIVIVTGSFYAWVKDWADTEGFDLLATECEVKDGKLTGKIQGINNTGAEKVRRIREMYDLDSEGKVFAYGNSRSDLEMLNIADVKYMRWQKVD